MQLSYVLALVVASAMFGHVICQEEETAVASGSTTVTTMFSCLRPGMNCLGDINATTCSEAGVCGCEDGLEGFDCSVNSTNILAETECVCQNGGLCVKAEDGTPACSCPSAFFGPACENERVFQQCQVDSIEMRITPFNNVAGFMGSMYVKNQGADTACIFTPGEPGTWGLTLSFEDCGGAENSTTAEGDVTQQFVVVVQYDDLLVTDTDHEFVFNCIIKKTDSIVANEDTDLPIDSDSPLPQEELTQEVLPVDVALVLAADDAPITGPVRIGTLCKLKMTLRGGEVYDSFRVESVVVHNGEDTESIEFVTGSCVSEVAGRNGKKIVSDFSGDVTSEMALTFKLFKFKLTNQLAFRINVKLCQGTGGCNATDCATSQFPGLGRKRRDVETPDVNDKFGELRAGVQVYGPGEEQYGLEPYHEEQKESVKTSPETNECFQNIGVLMIVIMAAILGIVCGAAMIFICMRMRKTKKEMMFDNGCDNRAYNTKI